MTEANTATGADVDVSATQLRLDVEDDPSQAEAGQHQLVKIPAHAGARPPRIARVLFTNFKGFEKFEATFATFNVLAGANNSGKSTLLQGTHLIYSLIKLHAEGDRLAATGRIVPAAILPVANLRDLFFKQVWRRANIYVPVGLRAEFSDGSHVEFSIRLLFGNANCRVTSEEGMMGARLHAFLGWPAVWVPSAVGIVRDEEFRPTARRVGLINAGRHNEVLRNMLFDLKARDHARLERLEEILAERFNASLSDVAFDPELDQFVTAGYSGPGDVQHDLYSAGSGFVQVVQLLAFLFASTPSVILLDEPDAHLHSSMQRVVIEILDELSANDELQVILATHSKEIINFVDPTRLIAVDAGAPAASPISDEVTPITILKSLGAIDNVDAYALVKNRKCLFLEGAGDSSILARFASRLGLRCFSGDDRVVVVPVGGADRFEHVQQLDVFEALLGTQIHSLEVRDRDARTEDNRTRLMKAARRPVHVLELDAIESYLIVPAVLARVVADVKSDRTGEAAQITEAEMQELIDVACDTIRDATVDRVSQRYISDAYAFDKEQVGVARANQIARTVVTEAWDDFSMRLKYVSGKKLLAKVRQAIAERFGVSFGNERLSEAFTRNDIPSELAQCLGAVDALGAD